MLLVVEFLVSMRDESRRRLFQVYCKGEYGINCGSKSMSLASQKGHHSHASSFIKHPVRPPPVGFCDRLEGVASDAATRSNSRLILLC